MSFRARRPRQARRRAWDTLCDPGHLGEGSAAADVKRDIRRAAANPIGRAHRVRTHGSMTRGELRSRWIMSRRLSLLTSFAAAARWPISDKIIARDPKLRHRVRLPGLCVRRQGRPRPRHSPIQRGDPARSSSRPGAQWPLLHALRSSAKCSRRWPIATNRYGWSQTIRILLIVAAFAYLNARTVGTAAISDNDAG
jgi:hypothetical protein